MSLHRRAHRLALTPVVLALAVTTVTACSGGDAPEEPTPGASTAEPTPQQPEPEAVPTRVRMGKVVGRLPAPRRKQLRRQVRPVVDGWLDRQWVDGPWPREVGDGFPGFTRQATRQARRDRGVTTLGDLGTRIDGVEVTRRAVRVDAVAAGRRPVGVTARVKLDLRTSGQVSRKVTLRGRLMLTRTKGGWKVFGYDVTKGKR